MFINPVAMIHDSAYSVMGNSAAIADSAVNSGGSNPTGLAQGEKALQFDSLNNQLQYKAGNEMYDSQKSVEKENIKRSFSTFA